MLLVPMKQKLLLIFTTLLLFATACSTTTDDEIAELRAELQEVETELAELKTEDSGADESGREQLLQEILAEPELGIGCLLYTSPSPRDRQKSRMPSSA